MAKDSEAPSPKKAVPIKKEKKTIQRKKSRLFRRMKDLPIGDIQLLMEYKRARLHEAPEGPPEGEPGGGSQRVPQRGPQGGGAFSSFGPDVGHPRSPQRRVASRWGNSPLRPASTNSP